jgi:hypothetical protein
MPCVTPLPAMQCQECDHVRWPPAGLVWSWGPTRRMQSPMKARMFVAVATVSVFATALASGVTLPHLSNSVVIDADGVVTAETAAHALALLNRLLTRSDLPSAEPRARAVRSLTHTDACTPALLSLLSCTYWLSTSHAALSPHCMLTHHGTHTADCFALTRPLASRSISLPRTRHR